MRAGRKGGRDEGKECCLDRGVVMGIGELVNWPNRKTVHSSTGCG